ncbi:hypothetical protein SUGI_0933620 [Cryptomeria japonica]|nr:hypothetical protein SUGI_0933620 [Cryptomeria japonica]
MGHYGLKIGKSLGNVLELRDPVEWFGSDDVRSFFLRKVEFGNNGDYLGERFISIVNVHLANTIWNLLIHTPGLLIKKNCQSTLAFDVNSTIEDNTAKESLKKMQTTGMKHTPPHVETSELWH